MAEVEATCSRLAAMSMTPSNTWATTSIDSRRCPRSLPKCLPDDLVQAALDAANLNLKDVREGVAEDAAITYLALDRDIRRQAALQQEQGFADRLVSIVQSGPRCGVWKKLARLPDSCRKW